MTWCAGFYRLAIGLMLASSAPATGTVSFSGAGGQFTVPVTSIQELRFHGVVKQQRDFSCGSAALATLLTYHYGHPASEHEIFDAMYAHGDQEAIQTHGFSMLDMKRYLASLGYRADGFRFSLDRIDAAEVPAITLIDAEGYKHFVVVKGVREETVLIGDPALGLRVIDRETFEAQWSGVLFVLHKGVDRERVSFDQDEEWAVRPVAPVDQALASPQLANFTLSLSQRSSL